MTFSALEKQQEAEREVKMRRRVYGNQMEKGMLDRRVAERRIGIMEEIAADYAKQVERERLI